jgi:hypothetical protein
MPRRNFESGFQSSRKRLLIRKVVVGRQHRNDGIIIDPFDA